MKGHLGEGLDEPVAFNLCLRLPLPAAPGKARSSSGGPSGPPAQLSQRLWRRCKPLAFPVIALFVPYPYPIKNTSQPPHREPCSLGTQPEKQVQKDAEAGGL